MNRGPLQTLDLVIYITNIIQSLHNNDVHSHYSDIWFLFNQWCINTWKSFCISDNWHGTYSSLIQCIYFGVIHRAYFALISGSYFALMRTAYGALMLSIYFAWMIKHFLAMILGTRFQLIHRSHCINACHIFCIGT